MKRLFKLMASLVTLVFTLVIVVLVIMLNTDPNNHKDRIAREFEKSTGLALSLNGSIDLSFYPWLGITLNDFVIANPPGFSNTPLMQAQQAELRVKLLPMLDQEYEIDTIHLTGARIFLETNAVGESNWDSGALSATESEESSVSDATLNKLVVGGVDINNASVIFDDQFNDVIYTLENINISTGKLVYGAPIELSLALDASASQPDLAALIRLTGTMVYDLGSQRYDLNPLSLNSTLLGANVPNGSADLTLTTAMSMDFEQDTLLLRDLSFNALDTRINANINANGILSDSPLFQVNLAAAGNDLAAIFRILENEDLVAQITRLNSRSFYVNGLFESSPGVGTLSVKGLDANLLDASITGDISASNLQSGQPVITGTINASGPDLPTLLEVAGQLQGGRNSALAGYGRELQNSPNQDFLLRTRFDANMETGNLNVPELELNALGTVISGNLTGSEVNTETPVLRGRLNASGPDLPLLMQIVGQISGGRESSLNQFGRNLRNIPGKNFTLNAPFDINMARGNIDLSGLQANFLGFRLSGELQATNFENANGTMIGELNLSGRNLGPVLSALDQADLAEVVESLNLNMAINGRPANLTLSPFNLDLILSGPRIPNSPVTLALRANSILDIENETLATESFTLAGLGLNLQGSLQTNNVMSDINYNGQLSLPAFNLRRFMQQINQPLPVAMDNTVFQSFALATSFSGSSDDLQLRQLDFTLDESRISGDFSLVGLSSATTPAMDFDLAINRINLDRYLAPTTDTPAGAEIGNTELPVDTLRELNIKGEINVGQLTYSNLNLNVLALNINASNGQLALAPVTANLYQGAYSGDIRLNVNDALPTASVETTLTGINLAPLLRDFMDASYISGNGNIQLSLNGRGADTATIKRNLNGSGAMALQDGVLEGVDVGSVLNQVEAMIREQRPRTVVRGERTPFETFSASIVINDGIVTTNDLLIESSGFDVTGRGTLVNLANDTIAFNMIANVDETPASNEQTYDIGGYSLPIACTGSINNPTCLPDIQAILGGAIRSAVQRGLTDLIQRAVGNEAQPQGNTGITQQNSEQTSPQDQQQEDPPAESDPREVLINRALESIFNR